MKTKERTEKKENSFGMNRTGIDVSPIDSKKMIEESVNLLQNPLIDVSQIIGIRDSYVQEADPNGSVPFPGTVKGNISALAEKLKGRNAEIFIDKLGERLAFERSGARLYEALNEKVRLLDPSGTIYPLDLLTRFHQEEINHFEMIWRCMKELGADPSAVTPCADWVGVNASGLTQVILDPRSSVQACLQAILIAELTDTDSWQLLVQLAKHMKMEEMADEFTKALKEEQVHLDNIRQIYEKEIVESIEAA